MTVIILRGRILEVAPLLLETKNPMATLAEMCIITAATTRQTKATKSKSNIFGMKHCKVMNTNRAKTKLSYTGRSL